MIANIYTNLGTPPKRPDVPFPAFPDQVIKIIEIAICAAWNLLKQSAIIDLQTANETQITKELQDSIIDVMNNGYVAGFVPEVFNQPIRDASVADYSGLSIEKKPDITIYLSGNLPLSADKGIFFECKPIGSITNYFGKNGLQRFCDGHYAWAMPHASMIAYVQRKTSPLTAKAAFEKQLETGKVLVDDHFEDSTANYHPIWVSIHSRSFVLLNGHQPGLITIRHIWLTP